MTMPKNLLRLLAVLLALALMAAACGDDDDSADDASSDTASSSADATSGDDASSGDDATSGDEETEDDGAADEAGDDEAMADEPSKVAFFGYANVNGFTQGIWTGVQDAAAAAGIEADLFDGQFDGAIQAEQIQNATTSGDYDIYIITANNGAAIIPAVEEAIAEGIAVTAVYSAVGPDFLTLDPQVDGMMFAGTPIAANGTGLGEMAVDACGDKDPCYVSYLIGFANFPLDDARTAAFEAAVGEASNVVLVDNAVGGYDLATGQAAA
ncbi:MAG: substrate-binding domain-containing protein, partial [Actinomycetota bacterium]